MLPSSTFIFIYIFPASVNRVAVQPLKFAFFWCIVHLHNTPQRCKNDVVMAISIEMYNIDNFEKYTDFWTSARMDETPFLWEVRGSGWDSAYFDTFVYLILYHPRVGVAVSYNSEFYRHIFRASDGTDFPNTMLPLPVLWHRAGGNLFCRNRAGSARR